MSCPVNTILTHAKTPTHDDFLPPSSGKKVTFASQVICRTGTPSAMDRHYVVEAESPFEGSPEASLRLSPSTIQKIGEERIKLRSCKSKDRETPFNRDIKQIREEEQSSLWFPLLSVAFFAFLAYGLYFDGPKEAEQR